MTYDVLVYSESLLKPEVSNDSICIGNFLLPFQTDMNNRLGGGRSRNICKGHVLVHTTNWFRNSGASGSLGRNFDRIKESFGRKILSAPKQRYALLQSHNWEYR